MDKRVKYRIKQKESVVHSIMAGRASCLQNTVAGTGSNQLLGVYANPNGPSSIFVTSGMVDNPRGLTGRDMPIGSLPMPAAGQSATLASGSLPKNLMTMPDATGHSDRLTDNSGNIVPLTQQ